MGGFFGVAGKHDCVADLFYGVDYHSHLGTRYGGLAVMNDAGEITRQIHDISASQFRSRFDPELDRFSGSVGIGCISDFDPQPLEVTSRNGRYVLLTVGKITNAAELVQEAFDSNHAHFCDTCDNEVNPTELTAYLINQKDTLVDGIVYAQQKIKGSLSILILSDHKIYAARDREGRTPVIVGEKADAFCVTFETTALPNLGYELKHELGPGEIVRITQDCVIQEHVPSDRMRICAFLWVYYGYPSSCYEGINAEEVRYRNGEIMARQTPPDVDVVSGIPDSGIAHAIGYGNASGIPYKRAFVKYTPSWARSFMPQSQQIRNLVAEMKLIPVASQIIGKRILFCDDSIVRGTQMRETVKKLLAMGAKEVHMGSACPPLLYGCRYLNFSRSRSELDLAARRAIAELEHTEEPTPEMLQRYADDATPEYRAMVEVIRKKLNLASLQFQTLSGLIEAIGLDRDKVCTYCWNGQE